MEISGFLRRKHNISQSLSSVKCLVHVLCQGKSFIFRVQFARLSYLSLCVYVQCHMQPDHRIAVG